jgi:hypothetical protein
MTFYNFSDEDAKRTSGPVWMGKSFEGRTGGPQPPSLPSNSPPNPPLSFREIEA